MHWFHGKLCLFFCFPRESGNFQENAIQNQKNKTQTGYMIFAGESMFAVIQQFSGAEIENAKIPIVIGFALIALFACFVKV